MKRSNLIATILLTLAVIGCRTADFTASREIEGTYIRVDKPNITLLILDGHFRQGGSDIYADGTYTSRKMGANKYELKLRYHDKLEGGKGTVIVRTDGEFIYTQDDGEGPETKFKKQ